MLSGAKENGKTGKEYGFFTILFCVSEVYTTCFSSLSHSILPNVIRDYLEKNKILISSYLDTFFTRKREALSFLGDTGQNALQRLHDFTVRGKMIRGGCAILAYSLFTDENIEKALPAAAAAEFFQSALLVHDDIMDRDLSRRGHPSLYHQYQQVLEKQSLPDSLHSGESLAICAGDIAFFLGYELLSLLRPPETGNRITEYASKELSNVAAAQMIDVRRGLDPEFPDEREIIKLYRYKTGRYTFSLPFWMGARLAGAEEKNLVLLEKIGELLGILFQIKDDELGLFGDEKVLGKPVGSDLREGKKTLHIALLYKMGSQKIRRELSAVNSAGTVSDPQVDTIRNAAEQLEIRRYIETRYLQPVSRELTTLLAELRDILPASRTLLTHLIDFILNRDK